MLFCVPRVIHGCSRVFSGSSLFAAALVPAFVFGGADPVQAQFFFDYGGYSRPAVVKKPKVRRTRPVQAEYDHSLIERGNKTKESVAARQPEGPLVITVSLRRQRVSVWDRRGLMMEAPVSSGKLGTPTPTGIYSVLQKNRVHFSNLYDSAPMPNMQRITWSGVALHAGALPGYPASHGCIRLPHGFSKRLFDVTQLGTRVIVSYDPVQPVEFSHPQLFAAYPEDGSSLHALVPGETRVADASDTLPSGASEQMGSVIGVSTGFAREMPPQYEAIEAYRAERRVEKERLAAALAAAQEEKATVVELATAAVKSLEARKLAVRDGRTEVARLAREARKAEQAARAANNQLTKFSKSLVQKTAFTPDDVAKATQDEDRLETAALDLADAADASSAAWAKAAEALAAAETALGEAETIRAAAANKVRSADAKLSTALDALESAKRREAKRKDPVHVFISRKTQMVYVRQGYEPIIEAPVTIDRPDEPMGTHVFTALAVDPGTAKVTWSAASIPTAAGATKSGASKPSPSEAARAASELRPFQTADAALQRVKLPENVRVRIEDVMKPGSSLIISDNGLSNETGKTTDFIVPVR
jgi:lipoprotein-anchoring transpeptidase ErfK/SrfK